MHAHTHACTHHHTCVKNGTTVRAMCEPNKDAALDNSYLSLIRDMLHVFASVGYTVQIVNTVWLTVCRLTACATHNVIKHTTTKPHLWNRTKALLPHLVGHNFARPHLALPSLSSWSVLLWWVALPQKGSKRGQSCRVTLWVWLSG